MDDREPRCHHCGKLLAEVVTRPWRIRCPRCKADNEGVLIPLDARLAPPLP